MKSYWCLEGVWVLVLIGLVLIVAQMGAPLAALRFPVWYVLAWAVWVAGLGVPRVSHRRSKPHG